MRASAQALHALDGKEVGGNAGNTCAHRVQHLAQLLQIRFTSSVVNGCRTFGKDCRHHDVCRTRHRSFIEQHIGALQFVGGDFIHATGNVVVEACAQLLYAEEVRIQTTTTDFVASGL